MKDLLQLTVPDKPLLLEPDKTLHSLQKRNRGVGEPPQTKAQISRKPSPSPKPYVGPAFLYHCWRDRALQVVLAAVRQEPTRNPNPALSAAVLSVLKADSDIFRVFWTFSGWGPVVVGIP